MSILTQTANLVRTGALTGVTVPALAASVIARQLGVSDRAVLARLSQGGRVVAEGLSLEDARRLCPLLAVAGLPVRVEPLCDRGNEARLDVCLFSREAAFAQRLQPRLAAALGRDQAGIAAHLLSSVGLVVESVPMPVFMAVRKLAREDRRLGLMCLSPEEAQFDLFARCPDQPLPPSLRRDLSILGFRGCEVTGALACGLDRRLRDHVLARHDASVLALDRSFQRYDLYMIDKGDLCPDDLRSFLMTRALPQAALAALARGEQRLRIETGLGARVVRQFMADYAAIGVTTEVRLVEPILPAETDLSSG